LGLGNPLPEYALTRHNVGHRVIEEMARRTNSRLRGRGNLQMAGSNLQGSQLILAKSLTYMNESGIAADEMVRRTGISPSHLLVVCDDINLPLGSLRLRRSGGDGGHKGLMSVSAYLNTVEFPRLRIGVGVLPSGEDAVGYVLGPFAGEEQPLVEQAVKRAADCLAMLVLDGIGEAMNYFNREPSAAPAETPEDT